MFCLLSFVALVAITAFVLAAGICYQCQLNLKKLKALADSQHHTVSTAQTSGTAEDQEDCLNQVISSSTNGKNNLNVRLEAGESRSRSSQHELRKRKKTDSDDSEEYWASDDTGGSSEDRKHPTKKVRVKRNPHTRFGVTDGSDSYSSDRDRPTTGSSQAKKPSSWTSTTEQGLQMDNGLSGSQQCVTLNHAVNYSGDERQKLLNSEPTKAAETKTPHDPKASYDCVVTRLTEENRTLKQESASKHKLATTTFNRVLGQKDKQIVDLKKEIEIRDQQINELVKQLKQDRITHEQVEELKQQLDDALKEMKRDRPAEEIPIGGCEAHRLLPQD